MLRLAREGKIPANKIGREWRFLRSAVRSYLAGESPDVVQRLMAKRGIRINEGKNAKCGFQNPSCDRRVHNISVSTRRGTRINRDQAAHARALAASYLAACKSVSPETLQALAYKRQRLTGWMHYCRQATIGPARQIRQHLEAGDRNVLRRLRALGIVPYRNKWWLVSPKTNEPRRIACLWTRMRLGERIAVGRKKEASLPT